MVYKKKTATNQNVFKEKNIMKYLLKKSLTKSDLNYMANK